MKSLSTFFVFGGVSGKQEQFENKDCNENPFLSPSNQIPIDQKAQYIDLSQFRSLIHKSVQSYDICNFETIFTENSLTVSQEYLNPQRKSVYINISDSFTRVAFYKPKYPLSSHILLTNPLSHDKQLVNYDLDSEQEYEDRFGEHLSESEKDCQSQDEDEKQYELAMMRNKKEAKSEAILQKMMNGFVIPDYQPLSEQSCNSRGDQQNFKTQNKYEQDKQKKYYQNFNRGIQSSNDDYDDDDVMQNEETSKNQYQNCILQKKYVSKIKAQPLQNTVFLWQVKQNQINQFRQNFQKGQVKFKKVDGSYYDFWLKSDSKSVREVIGNSRSLINHEKLTNLINISKDKLARNRSAITKYVDQLAIEIHGSYLPKTKIIQMFHQK